MALFENKAQLQVSDVLELRKQGLTDNLIIEELKNKGFKVEDISLVLAQTDGSAPLVEIPSQPDTLKQGLNQGADRGTQGIDYGVSSIADSSSANIHGGSSNNIYERIEEITESIVDEKWDELIAEVRKIVDWKQKFEEKQMRMASDLEKLKEDFKVLHQGVLGKLEDYDTKMREVGTDLKAVGKVFKDTIPEFVENVKELRSIVRK